MKLTRRALLLAPLGLVAKPLVGMLRIEPKYTIAIECESNAQVYYMIAYGRDWQSYTNYHISNPRIWQGSLEEAALLQVRSTAKGLTTIVVPVPMKYWH